MDAVVKTSSTRRSEAHVTDQKAIIRPTREEAEAYAKKHGIEYRVQEPKEAKRRTISYSDNFRYDRKVPWTH